MAGVFAVALQLDRDCDVVRPFFDDRFETNRLQQVLGIRLEVQDDGRSGRLARGGFQGEDAAAGGFPFPGLVAADLAGDHLDFVGDHEGGVEADAELADQARALFRLGLLGKAGGERGGAGAGDGAEMVGQFLLAHAGAAVGDGDGAGELIRRDLDARGLRKGKTFIGQGEEAALVDGVGRVGDQLAEENLAVGVQRVDHEVQQAADLGAKLPGLFRRFGCRVRFAHGGLPLVGAQLGDQP